MLIKVCNDTLVGNNDKKRIKIWKEKLNVKIIASKKLVAEVSVIQNK